jgi:hypothetical protein
MDVILFFQNHNFINKIFSISVFIIKIKKIEINLKFKCKYIITNEPARSKH